MNPADYIPLEGRLRGPLYSSRLYMGEDHLLKSTIAGTHETYRRFAWEGIQAFVMQNTAWYGILNAIGGLGLFILGMTYLTRDEYSASTHISHGILIVLCVVGLMVNIRSGTTCRVWVRTAVSEEVLSSLYRVKVANRVIAQLRPIILARQAPASPPPA